ncbi:MAG: twin-arginine translocase subunit TatC [Bacteriovoracaceae bacterium]|nr:twin-arginine translocase subunit TatC [Bacteriovoracaceae bacterium]
MQEKSVLEHLEELRTTIIYISVIILASFMVTFHFGSFCSELLLAPLRDVFSSDALLTDGKIIYLGILDKILSQFQVSLWVSIIISSPLWFYQVWRFIRPGLYPQEVKVIAPFIFFSFILFCLGVGFAYFIVLPLLIKVLGHFGVSGVQATIGLKEYLILASKILVLAGFVFQVPNILLVIGLMGVVKEEQLRQKRRYVYVVLAILSAMITPPDVLTMLILWGPLILLYEVGLLLFIIIVRPYLKRSEQ